MIHRERRIIREKWQLPGIYYSAMVYSFWYFSFWYFSFRYSNRETFSFWSIPIDIREREERWSFFLRNWRKDWKNSLCMIFGYILLGSAWWKSEHPPAFGLERGTVSKGFIQLYQRYQEEDIPSESGQFISLYSKVSTVSAMRTPAYLPIYLHSL